MSEGEGSSRRLRRIGPWHRTPRAVKTLPRLGWKLRGRNHPHQLSRTESRQCKAWRRRRASRAFGAKVNVESGLAPVGESLPPRNDSGRPPPWPVAFSVHGAAGLKDDADKRSERPGTEEVDGPVRDCVRKIEFFFDRGPYRPSEGECFNNRTENRLSLGIFCNRSQSLIRGDKR